MLPSLAVRAAWLPKVYIPGEKMIVVSLFLGLLLLYVTYPSWQLYPLLHLSPVFKYIPLVEVKNPLPLSAPLTMFYNLSISSFSVPIYCLKHTFY